MRLPVIISIVLLLAASCAREEPTPPAPTPDPGGGESAFVDANRWIYASMNAYYLWREDMPDSLDCDFTAAPVDFFQSILSEKDRFSYMFSNPDYTGGGGEERDFGFEGQLCVDARGVKGLRVDYITSRAASEAGLQRGDYVEVLSDEGEEIALRRIAVAPDGNFSDVHEDIIRYAAMPGEESSTVLCHKILDIGTHRIGYMCYLEYDTTDDFLPAMREFQAAGIETLILDLRYNPGGYVKTCGFLGACIGSRDVPGSVYQICTYNDRYSAELEEKTGSPTSVSYYPLAPGSGNLNIMQQIIPLSLPKLYVITSSRTASASEAQIVCLRPYMEVIQIGESTVGKGVGSWSITSPHFKYGLQPITMRYHNSLGATTPDTGLVPDFPVEDVLAAPRGKMGDPDEPVLNAALDIVVNGGPGSSAGIRSRKRDTQIREVGEPTYIRKYRSRAGRMTENI